MKPVKMAQMALLHTPAKVQLRLDGNNEATWLTFKEDFNFFMLSAGFKKADDDEKIALLINLGGEELKTIYQSLSWAAATEQIPDESQHFDSVLKKFDAYFHVKKNFLSSRKIFSNMQQQSDENLEQFITRIKTKVKDCDFSGDELQSQMRDRLIFGCSDDNLREKFFREDYTKLTFTRAIEICTSYCSAKRQIAACKEENIHAIGRSGGRKPQWRFKKDRKNASDDHVKVKSSASDSDSYFRECKFCAQKHKWGRDHCPAYGKKCGLCGETNHFAVRCPKSEKTKGGKTSKNKKSVHAVRDDYDESESDDENTHVHYVMAVNKDKKSVMAQMEIVATGVNAKFQVDTGASVSVITSSLVPRDVTLDPVKVPLRVWNEEEVHPEGKCRIIIRNAKNRKKYSVEFIVVKEKLTPILSKKASEQMDLLTVNYENIKAVKCDNVIDEFQDVFGEELGVLPGKVRLTVDPQAKPVAVANCRVPISIKEKVKQKLCDMEKTGVVVKVEEPTDWVSRMVTSTKSSGDIRICIDPLALNMALQREMHPLPTIDDVLPELSKARVFSKFDLRNGYWHCELDSDSSELTTFQTPFGRYRWTRLPFGLKVSSEIFQKRLQQSLEGLTNIICVADDILVYGIGDCDSEARKSHDDALRCLLARCQKLGIRLNGQKTALREKEVLFLGHKIGRDGLCADPSKVESIVRMKSPENRQEVMQVAGMVNYLSKFLPHLSDVMRPIRKLTHKTVPWEWGDEQQRAFEQMKEIVTKAPILSYYDPNEQLVIQCDASQSGLGCVLMQKGRPLSYASRALTTTEAKYAQIEKEALAILFSVKKFHQYTFGRNVTVMSDHKPLQAIVKKPLCMAPKRLQAMLLKLQEYDVEVVYLPGKEMHIADLLSRSYLKTTQGSEEFEIVCHVSSLPIREERLRKIQQASRDDHVINKLRNVISEGWPEHKSEAPVEIHAYFHYRDEMVTQDGLVFKGDQVVVPESMRKEVRAALHASHLGIESTLRRARQCVYWPGMTADLKEFISQCDSCNKFMTKQQKETLMTSEPTDRPFEKVAVDLFECEGCDYLIMVDYYSNWFEFDKLRRTTSKSVITKLKCHFARFGCPQILISDNGPQFVSDEFEEFMNEWDIEHRTSSPGHQQANGLAESAVKRAKKLIEKTLDSGQDLMLALLEARNVPNQDAGSSPAQRMYGRMTRTLLPVKTSKLKPHESETMKINRRLQNDRKEWYYNKHAKDMNPLQEGEIVRMRPMIKNSDKWRKGLVTKRFDERSYEVECEGTIYRRNRVDLRATNEPIDNPEDKGVMSNENAQEPKGNEPMNNVPNTINDEEIVHDRQIVHDRSNEQMTETPRRQSRTKVQSPSGPNQDGTNTPERRVSNRSRKQPNYLKDYFTK